MPESFEAANSTDPSPDETSKVKYVLSGQPTGWAAMAKEVREFDEEKVKSCKEDIDTLLVFAGLFSAVLSAFLIAAYPALQPDRMDMVVYTLQLIATQTAGYKQIGDVIITSGSPPPLLPSFTPAANDIRINILWFASLVISLVTASFAMLVKQWLREFLAVEVPSPQARLRVRHFREPQLLKWKVYEISALLPLLLQLSLGLFFIGLCYFTAAIHSGIGYTTLPLVVGWALFFFTSTALPIFFPRCPYRTTLLKTAVSQLHRGIGHLADWSRDMLRPNSNPPFGPRNHTSLSSRPHSSDVLTFCRTLSKGILRRVLPDRQSLPDERNIVKDQDQDVDILLSVDAIQANDELLCTAISEALSYGRPDWTSVVDFAIEILAHRLPTVAPSDRMLLEWPFLDCFPFSSVRPQVIEAIIGILSNNIKKNMQQSYTSVLVPNEIHSREAEHTRLLCMFSVLIAAADVSTKFITSHTGICDILRPLLCDSESYSDLWKDWIQLASGQVAESEERREVTYRLLHVLTWLVEPLNLSVPNGVALFEILTETKLDTLWKTHEYIDWAILSSGLYAFIQTPAEYLSILLCTEFQRSISWQTREREAIVRRVLNSTLRLYVAVLGCEARICSRGRAFWRTRRVVMGNDLALHYSKVLMGQVIVLQYLTKTVVHAMRSEAGTQLFIDALLDVEDGALQPTSILFVKPCLPKDYNPPYRWETRTPLHALANRPLQLLDLTGVLANLKTALSEKLTHCDSTLSSALQLCQAAMVILLCVPPYKGDIHLEARTIFAQFGITLRSMMTERINTRLTAAASGVPHGHQLHEDHTINEAEIAHACLSALSAHDDYENRNKIPESDSIFPDELVEILIELNTSQSRGLPTSSLRRRRIKDKWTTLALEHIRELWPDTPEAEADTIGCTNDADAGELRVDKDSRTNSRVHVDLDNSRLTKVDSVHSTLESTHGETGHGHDIADNAEMPGADRDSSVNSISAD